MGVETGRKKRMTVSDSDLTQLLTGKSKIVLPGDAEICTVERGYCWGMTEVVVASNEFPRVIIGAVIKREPAVIEIIKPSDALAVIEEIKPENTA